jgi:RNA 3'-terminal phosphate cyclase (ATP)/RNA 3'-terminal phosphate cyclase (GTP)
MREIDGSYGEGGGQLLRTAVALSAITGEPVRIVNIRAKRSNPGMAAQHVAAVRAVAMLCDARTEGLQIQSREIVFYPGPLRGGDFRFDIGTAGSITLVLQAALPAALVCGEACRMRITGGTDVRAAPPLDYFRHVLLPLLDPMGVRAAITILRRGYYPRGGGEIEVEVRPARRLRPRQLDAPGAVKEIVGWAHVSNLPFHVAQRMAQSARQALAPLPPAAIELVALGREEAIGAGGAMVLAARSEHTLLGASAVAERGVPAEKLGETAGWALREEISAGATLDIHAADQMLAYFALADGPSRFLARSFSTHAATAAWLLEQFLPVRITAIPEGRLVRVEVTPVQDEFAPKPPPPFPTHPPARRSAAPSGSAPPGPGTRTPPGGSRRRNPWPGRGSFPGCGCRNPRIAP